MSITVHVENFQSLQDVTVEISGLTVVTGTNNAGKSALMRAIRAAFQNARGNSFIRYGTTKTAVDINFNDGKRLRWEKGKGAGDKPTYIVNGGDPIHPGQGVPDEVKKLGVRPIVISGREVWPQFAPQVTGQVFLLDQPGSMLAEAVSDVNHVSQLNEALRLAESDKRSAASELKIRILDRDSAAALVNKYVGLDDIDDATTKIEADYAKAVKVKSVLNVATQMRDKLDVAVSVVSKLSGSSSIDIPDDASVRSINEAIVSLEWATSVKRKLDMLAECVSSIDGVEAVSPPVDDINGMYSALIDIDDITKMSNDMSKLSAVVLGLSGVNTIEDVDVSDVETIFDTIASLVSVRDQMALSVSTLDKITSSIASTEADLAVVLSNIESALGDMGECPTCGSIHTNGNHK